ncbi:MAG: prepilin-type N-terminal cleavage/methylation domain-containing protein [Gammaproteobacteria bacterium]|nr:prepilin-type N-terminal cleavage/methylation domain-containing protein [Gammaproteobacteria bacterium]
MHIGLATTSRATRPVRARQHGVTLMELLTVVVVVGILSTIAVPTYRSYVIRAQRTEAKNALLATAGALERCFTRFNAYDDANCAAANELPRTLPEGNYRIEADTLEAGNFELHAVPLGGQTEDAECRTLTLDLRNERGVTGGATKDAQFCWNR